jgi:hypothetical protein
MSILSNQAENVLRTALESPYGIQILIYEDPPGQVVTPTLRARQILYRFRQEIGDKDMDQIQIRLCPTDPDHRLWLVKNPG